MRLQCSNHGNERPERSFFGPNVICEITVFSIQSEWHANAELVNHGAPFLHKKVTQAPHRVNEVVLEILANSSRVEFHGKFVI